MQVAPRGTVVLSISTIMVLAALSGCVAPSDGGDGGSDGNDSGSSGDGGDGTVSFFVKDAPADDFVSVFVTFNEVKVHRAGDADADDNALTTVPDDDLSTVPDDDLSTVPHDDLEEDGSGAGWFTIFEGTKTIDLKQFQGDARAFLGEETIDAGKYTQIRIMVTDVYGEKEDGARTNFTLPSNTLKIVRPWTVVDGEVTTLVVDFDLEQSIQKRGNGQYSMRPVLKLTIENGAPEGADSGETDEPESGEQGGKPTNVTKPSNTRKP